MPWVWRVARRGLSHTWAPASVTSTSRTVSPARCPPLTSTARQPSASKDSPAARIAVTSPIAMPHRISASGRFGVSTVARPISSRFSASTASGSISRAPPLAAITGSTTSGRPAARCAQYCGERFDYRGIVQHAGFDRVGADIVEHHLDLLADEFWRDRQHAEDAQGVLRGQRSDRRRCVGTEHRHRLDIGLDAGAAAGIRAGDDQHPPAHDCAACTIPPPGTRPGAAQSAMACRQVPPSGSRRRSPRPPAPPIARPRLRPSPGSRAPSPIAG